MDPVSKSIAEAIARLELAGESILVAVSGGVDSSVLLHALSSVAPDFSLHIEVAHVNHGLRGEESEADQKAVEAQSGALGHACHVVRVDIESEREGHPSRTRPTRQEAARIVRYRALNTVAQKLGTDRIATAHQLDDQAETILMRVLRGSGTDALAGIRERSHDGRVVRPLLRVGREDIERYATRHQIVWREDRSNDDPSYARNKMRREIVPLLSQTVNPQLRESLAQLGDAHRRDADWIAGLVGLEFERRFRALDSIEETGFEIVKAGWGDLHEALSSRLVVRAFEALGAGRDLSRVHVRRMLDFLGEGVGAHGGREIELPGGLRLKRRRECFQLYRIGAEAG